jgi:integrase
MIESNPAYQVPRPAPERSRDRVLSDDEIRRLWLALDSEPVRIASVFKLAILTAARRSEVLGMTWAELDLDGGWWTLPAERSKNKLAHRVPLVAAALQMLRILHDGPHDIEFVFRGGRRGHPLANPQKWLARVRTRAELSDFRLHDLRRTVASNLTRLGVPRLTVSKLLNHVESSVTAVYDRHSYDAEKRAALARWERRLSDIVTGEASPKVVALR